MGCGGCPNHRRHYLKRVTAATTGQHHDTYIMYDIFYNTTSEYINIVTSKQNTMTQSKFINSTKELPQGLQFPIKNLP